MCLISLILAVTSTDTLDECLNSIYSQTFNNYEVIIIHNENKNAGNDLLYYKEDKRFKSINNNGHNSINTLKNKAITIARGKFINFLTSDTIINEKNSLQKISEKLEKHDSEMFSSNTLFMYDDYSKTAYNPFINLSHVKIYTKEEEVLPSEYSSPLFLSRNFIKKDFLIKNNIHFPDIGNDTDMLFLSEVLTKIDSYITIPEIYSNKTLSISHEDTPEKIIECLKHYNYMLKIFEDRKKYEKILEKISWSIINIKEYESNAFSNKTYKLLELEIENTNKIFDENDFYLSYKIKRSLRYFKNRIYNRITQFNVAISIIIPTYNVEEYIDECLISLLSQTFQNFEIIIIDDSSTDNTLSIIRKYQKMDYRIKFVEKTRKCGSGGSRNLGMEYARGKYLLFMDADDWIDNNALEKLYSYSEEYETDIVMFKLINYNEIEKIFYYTDYLSINAIKRYDNSVFNIDDVEKDLFKISVTPVNKLYSRSFLESINVKYPENYIHQDNPFFYETFCNAEKVYLTDEYFYNRRLTNSSISTRIDNTQIGTIEIIEYILKVFLKYNLYEKYKKPLNNLLIYKVRNRRRQVGNEFGEEYYLKARKKFFKLMNEYKLEDDLNENLNTKNKEYFLAVTCSKDYREYLDVEKSKNF